MINELGERRAGRNGRTRIAALVSNEAEQLAKQLEAKGMTVIRPDLEPFRERAKEVVKQFPALQPWYAKIVAQ